ncbi:LytTR family transcriptional regulator DNA-binding domain-containing protein [Pseudonocardia hispaniensis]|uniref:LytTR family transcriptional regulator DNA-binding domain-containing protein n=1 Tax=Pseudonocardia hispaniensis TaxID=904933 RepID=A0ABW1IWE2_9PSEU
MRSDVAQPDPAVRDARRRRAETLAAWERFIAGDDELAAARLPPAILQSWRRCRDVHDLDPVHPSPRTHRQHRRVTPRYDGVYAQLGAVAAAIVDDVGDCLATVTDADAQILASWGARGLSEHATDGRFEPQVRWPESVGGTNGMGTALLLSQPVAVRGPEHWRLDMHEWNCLGLALHDPVTARPVGTLNVSARAEDRVTGLITRLAAELETVRRYLRHLALRDAMAVAERFSAESSRRPGNLLGLDLAGNVIAASESVRKAVGGIPPGFLLEPASRRGATFAPLRVVAEDSFGKALADPSWQGTAVIGPPLREDPQAYAVTPVTGPTGLAGWILSDHRETHDSGPILDTVEHRSAPDTPERIAALAGDSVLLLDPHEVRFAEANRHIVWLTTDCGRFRAVTKGMDNLERELARYGFLRVHRSFLINPSRVRRVVHKGSGLIALCTDHHRTESIPVSRRSTHEVRQRLGI